MDKALMNGSLRYELEMACNFTQLVLFRPFLHYLRVIADRRAISLAESWHSLACIKLPRPCACLGVGVHAFPCNNVSHFPDFCSQWDFAAKRSLAKSYCWHPDFDGERMCDDGASSCLKVIKVSRSRMPQLRLNVLMNCKGSCPAAQSYG